MTVIVITGASRGIGLSTSTRLAATGATVFAGARSPERLIARLQGDDQLAGLDVRPLALDVTDDSSVAAAARHIQDVVGSVDVLINNAAVPGTPARAEEVTPSDFSDVFATNVLGPVRVTHAFLPLLRRSEHPRLIMVSSGMGSLTLQANGEHYRDIAHLPYPAMKAALNMLTVQYAKALPDICVTAIDPGLTATDFTGGSGHTVEEGSEAVVTAALDTTHQSGRFLDRNGPTPW